MARIRVYTAEQKAARCVFMKLHREANPDKYKAIDAAKWIRIKNDPIKIEKERERTRKATAKWRSENPEKAKENNDKYRAENTEKRKLAVARWRALNFSKYSEIQSEWRKNNSERMRIHAQNRRNKENESGKLTHGLMEKLMLLQKSKCACCHINLNIVKIHLDHIMPISLGGTNTDDNIQLLCQTCNQQKHAKHPVDFMQSIGFLL